MYKPPGGLYMEGRFNGGFFALPVWGAYFRDFTVFMAWITLRGVITGTSLGSRAEDFPRLL